MSYDQALTAMRERDINKLIELFFDNTSATLHSSFKVENDLWDYKLTLPKLKSPALVWAELSKDILAFHNTRRGGIIVFGIEDGSYAAVGIKESVDIDNKITNDKIRKYLGDQLWVDLYTSVRVGEHSFAFLLIPGLNGSIKRFIKNGPEKNSKPLFVKDGSAIRKGDSSITLNVDDANTFALKSDSLTYRMYKIDSQGYQILNPDYDEFIRREKYCSEIQKGLQKNRVSAVTLTGIGGIGKTSLAIWATEQAFLSKSYDYIISMTAKDRELTGAGIQAIYQGFTTLDDILNNILKVIGLGEYISDSVNNKEKIVRELFENENVLILLDNLETTTDARIEAFLNDLPDGVKAIVTSRRNVVRVSSYPIEVEGLEDDEIVRYITSLANVCDACAVLSRPEKLMIGEACNRIPLAIKWLVSRCKTSQELLSFSSSMESNPTTNSELLEFVFRRIFDKMTPTEKRIVQVLSIASDIPDEALIQGCYDIIEDVHSSLELLVRDTIVIKKFDNDLNWYKYSLLPLTKGFILKNCTTASEDQNIRNRLRAWYQAEDINDPDERLIVQNMRQNGEDVGDALVAIALNAQKRGDYVNAARMFEQAIVRDPYNWKVYKAYAEHYRDIESNIALAIQNYQKAIEYLPKGDDSAKGAIVRREFAMLYLKSGLQNAVDVSIKQLEIARRIMPFDPIAARFLGEAYMMKGYNNKVVSTLSDFIDTKDRKTQMKIWPLLLKAYEKEPVKYMLEITKMKDKLKNAKVDI